jgi:prepilin peptidase CpaA
MEEFYSLLQLLALLLIDPRTGVLFALLVVASVSDYRSYRIPNWLTVSGMAFGLIYNTAYPLMPGAGFRWSLGGLVLGLLTMLPLYVLKAMGAGDVKLMAMVGAFLGVPEAIFPFPTSLLASIVFHRV